ncbi:MAG: putative Ig domain-containing protein, partial [Chloroflexota bacterium]
NFGGALQGYLLLASYNNKIYQVELSADGKTALNCPTRPPLGTTVATCSIGSAEFASNFGSTPLDVIAQGDTDPFGGTVWSVTYGANSITVFEPGDYDGSDPNVCTGADDDTIDEDGDGYTNADEIDNNSNPCSGAVQPTDFDKTLEYTANDTDFLRSDLNDNDDDNDTLVDTIDPFPLDCSNGLGGSCDAIALGFVDIGGGLQFFNETGYGFGTLGLTGIMTNGTTDYLDLIDNVNNELVFGGTAGIYTDVSVADTTPVGAGGNHVNGWQFSLNTDINTEPFQIETQMNGPLFSALTSGDSAWQGLQIGTGDQDNFIMFVLEEDDLGTRFRVYAENNGVEIYNVTATAPTSVLDPGTIRMYLSPDPAAGTVQASYQFVPQSGNVGPLTTVGIAVPLQGDALAALQGTYTLSGVPSALAIGMVGNSTQADPPVGMSWDFFNIDIVPSSAEAFVSAATNGLLGSTFNPGSIVVENNSEPGITITNVTFDLAGAMIPEIVFDPDGTAGDDVGRGFFPDTAEETATGATNAVFSDAYEGGFYELSVDFTDFDPGEQISFGVDIDPVSVKGGSAPGPGESASVSGLEMAGSTVTVTYSNGETQVVELYRTQPDADSAAQNIVTNAKPLTPSIEIAGESSQTILFDEAQTINVIADAEDTVYLLQLETAMFLDGLDGPNAPDGYNVDPWEVNSILTISEYESTVANGGVASIPVSLLNTDPEGGFNIFAAVVVKTLEGGDIVTSDLSNYIIVKYDPASAPNSSYRINAGGVTIPATDGGLNWESVGDGAQSGTGYSVNGGILIAFEVDSLDPSVPSYAPLSLFAEEKFDAPGDANMIWTFDVDPDTYIVRLFMGNGFDGADQIGDREFGINIEGTQVLTGFDPVEEFGHKVGGMKEFVVENTDGVIDIEFIPGIENPLINAIEISPYDVGAETPILVTNIPNQINVEGQAADFDVAATGGDGGSLVYTAEGLPPGIGLQPTNGDIIGTVDFGAADNSPYNVTITVDDNDFTSVDAVTVNFLWTISDGSAPVESVVYRVNSGGPSIAAADASLPAWSADLDNPNSPFLSQAGSNSTFTSGDPITNDVSIPASVPEALLQSSRFDLAGGDEMAYSFPVE